MNFPHPKNIYTAATNLEAHVIVEMLESAGVEAHVVEDQSGVSLWMLGTISQFHKPCIWVNETNADRAKELILEFEQHNQQRLYHDFGDEIHVLCENCGKTTPFPVSLNGSTQTCPHCFVYIDVGEQPQFEDEDFDPNEVENP